MREALAAMASTIREAAGRGEALAIRGGDSKGFLGHPVEGLPLATDGLSGIVEYEPSELVVTAGAGTPIAELEAALDAEGQMLPFEPPRLSGSGTLGGAIASGLSGPGRPFRGAARDYVLGCRVLDGTGNALAFGGRVMKNVAGYDLARLLTGSMGCLAVLTEVSLKVLPRPEHELTLALECGEAQAIERLAAYATAPLPLSAASHVDGVLRLRLSGASSALAAARRRIGGEETGGEHFTGLRDQKLDIFEAGPTLWRLSVPSATPPLDLPGHRLIDWAGAQRWVAGEADGTAIRDAAAAAGGHATRYRGGDAHTPAFHPLPPALLALHRRLKAALDPAGIFNPGRMYAEL